MDFARKAHELPHWGSFERNFALRKLYLADKNSMVTSAIQQLIRRIKQTPWVLVGGPTLTTYFQTLFQMAEFEDGFDVLLTKLLTDYFTLDIGAFLEIVGPGDSSEPLTQRATGLVALDGLRCWPTGNREWPVFYRSHRTGELHRLHRTRVIRLVDMPSPDPFFKNLGFCALSRAATVAQAQIMLMNQEIEALADSPANGIITFAGIAREKLLTSMQSFIDAKDADIAPILRNLLQLTSTDPANPVKVELIPFSQLPVGYNHDDIIRNHVNLIALAIGVDPQDLWPLATKSMGSGLQSEVLHAKGQGKAYGDTVSLLTRVINIGVLPKSLEMRFKPRDGEREQQDADVAQTWMGVAQLGVTSGIMSAAQGALLISNNVDAFADVLLDQAGNLRLQDNDARDPAQPEDTANPATPSDKVVPVPTVAPGANPNKTPVANDQAQGGDKTPNGPSAHKALQATRLDFEGDLEDLLKSAVTGETARRRFGVVFRALLLKYGRKAFQDGLTEGGVNLMDMDAQDDKTVVQLSVSQSAYVTNLGDAIFQAQNVTEAMASQKPEVWFNKSIYPFYVAGLQSADQNGYYGWAYGNTIEHCANCSEFADGGHIHRLKDWIGSGWQPKTHRLECHGYNCDCKFFKTDGPAIGTLTKTKVHTHGS